ncbi:hypothetical protein BGZ52_007474, partial [Haplosporangium bisporale]
DTEKDVPRYIVYSSHEWWAKYLNVNRLSSHNAKALLVGTLDDYMMSDEKEDALEQDLEQLGKT